MAKRFAVVPEHMLNQLKSVVPKESTTEPPTVSYQADDVTDPFDDVINMLSKTLRNRARVLLHTLGNSISINKENRIIYPDETIGSHLYILLNYHLNNFKTKEQPFDYTKFKKLLSQNEPRDEMRKNWVHLYSD